MAPFTIGGAESSAPTAPVKMSMRIASLSRLSRDARSDFLTNRPRHRPLRSARTSTEASMAQRPVIHRLPPGGVRVLPRACATHNDPTGSSRARRSTTAEVLAPFRALIAALGERLEAAGVPLVGDPDRGIFRIYRDVRFSAEQAALQDPPGRRADPLGRQAAIRACSTSMSSRASRWRGSASWHPEPDAADPAAPARSSTIPTGF